MGRGVIFVRHAMPAVSPGVASALWPLAESSRQDCVLLAHAMRPGSVGAIVSSAQPKAAETAAIVALRLGLDAWSDERLSEVDQPAEWYECDYRAVADGYLRGDVPRGWEPRDAVVARFTAAVDDALSGARGDVVVVNHGLAMSLFLAAKAPMVRSRGGGGPFELVPFWRALTFPDAWRLDLESNVLECVSHGGLAPG